MTTAATSEACTRRWCDELPRLTAADLAAELGGSFGEAALATGESELALAWARAYGVGSVVGRSTALGRLASAARDAGEPELARWLFSEASACAQYEWHRVDLLVDAELDDPALFAIVRDRLARLGDDRRGPAERAWCLVRARLAASEEAAQLEIVGQTLARLSPDDERRVAADAALWIVHARRGEAKAASLARQRVVEAVEAGLDVLPPARARAVIAAAAAAGELAAIAPSLPWLLLRDIVVAHVRTGDVAGALARPHPPVWLPAVLARLLPDDPRAPAWSASAEASEAIVAEQADEGLLTSFELRDARIELAALRGRSDPGRGRAGLGEAIRDDVERLHATLQATRALVAGVGAGTRELALVGDDKWQTPRGERALARALERWCGAPDWAERYRQGRDGATIFAAATAFALAGDQPRALELMERGFVGDESLVSLIEAVQPALVTAWLATDQIERALGLAWADPLGGEALGPLLVELVAFDHAEDALALLGPGLERATSCAELRALAPAILAVADDREACAAAMLAALARAEAEIAGFTALAAGQSAAVP